MIVAGQPPSDYALGSGAKTGMLCALPRGAPMIRLFPSLLVLTSLFWLCQCGVPKPPQCRMVPIGSRQAPEKLLAQAHAAWHVLKVRPSGPKADEARAKYNESLTKLFDQLRCGPNGWDSRAAALGTVVDRSNGLQDPDRLDAVIHARRVKVRKLGAHRKTEGVGVPTVGWKKTSPVGSPRDPYLLPNGLPYHLNVMLDFDGPQPRWQFRKRWREEEVRIGTVTHTLAGDWSAPNEFYWKMCQLDNLLVQNVILPDRFTEETGLYFVTPYEPGKIPVVFVHGLVSSPDAFKNVLNELMPEKWFRDNYQIWLYNYPTGNPWIYSSMMFREKMREALAYARSTGGNGKLDRMVIVSHSMGGLLTRSSVSDPGSRLYNGVFVKRPDELPLDAGKRRLLDQTFFYQPLREPKRVVFMAVPHRGSPMATWKPSQWIARLIRLPKTITVELLDSTLMAVADAFDGQSTYQAPTSINSLAPHAPTTRALADVPLPKGIGFHSIIGDRGKGNTPQSSDGVVPYWSSHVKPVVSEKIVPSGHGVPDNPEAAEELKRILLLHLKETGIRSSPGKGSLASRSR